MKSQQKQTEKQNKLREILNAKLKDGQPGLKIEVQQESEPSEAVPQLQRHQSIDGQSQASYQSKQSYGQQSQFTAKTSINAYSIVEQDTTPTTLKKKQTLMQAAEEPLHPEAPLISAFDAPRVFLNIDDEEEVRRSKERHLKLMAQMREDNHAQMMKAKIDPDRIRLNLKIPKNSQNPRRNTKDVGAQKIMDEVKEETYHSRVTTSKGSKIDSQDIATQVYSTISSRRSRSRSQRYADRSQFVNQINMPLLEIGLCEYDGCSGQSIGNRCTFKMMCAKGCQRRVCNFHAAKVDNPEQNAFAGKLCTECEPKANKAFWISILVLFGFFLMLALPGIILYGSDTTSVPPALQGLE